MAQPPPDQQGPSNSGIVFPGYRYLGPGNSLNRGVPINALDAAAKKHDEKYHKITEYYKKTKNRKQFEHDIQVADIEFVEEVATFAPETAVDKVAQWLAYGGIEAKHILEKYTGIIYPRVSAEAESGIMEVPGNLNSIIGNGVQNHNNVHKFEFKKKFTFAIGSTKASYTKSSSDVVYDTYIHSLPWQKLYFYITEKEYDDMTTVFHTSKVTQVGIKITNLGNRTPFLTSTSSVNYANANSQTTIGIWENMECLAPVEMGSNITATTLYGKTLESYAAGADQDPDHSTAQAKLVDNRIRYKFHLNGVNKHFLLPPLIMESTILYNATNSIGPIFEKTYKPQDGTFHAHNDGFESGDYIIRNEPMAILLHTGNTSVRSVTSVKSNTKKYDEATVDNLTIGGLYKNAQKDFMGSIGVGIIPLLNKDGSLEDAILNIMVETKIEIECISHGTNLLMGKYNKAQPNTLFSGLAIDKYKWSNKYTVAGAPAVDEGGMSMAVDETYYEEPQPEPQPKPQPKPQPEPQPQPGPSRASKRKNEAAESRTKQPKMWYNDGENLEIDAEQVIYVRAEKIPGQKKITSKMSDEEKLATAEENERIRQAAIQMAEIETLKKIYLTGKFLNLGIPEQGYYDKNNPKHREAVLNTATTPKPPVVPQPPIEELEERVAELARKEKTTEPMPETQLPKPIVPKKLTTLVIRCENHDNTMYLYETDQQLEENLSRKRPQMIKVEKQPTEEIIKFSTKYNDAWPSINFNLRHKLSQKDRGQVYWWLLKNMEKYGYIVPT